MHKLKSGKKRAKDHSSRACTVTVITTFRQWLQLFAARAAELDPSPRRTVWTQAARGAGQHCSCSTRIEHSLNVMQGM